MEEKKKKTTASGKKTSTNKNSNAKKSTTTKKASSTKKTTTKKTNTKKTTSTKKTTTKVKTPKVVEKVESKEESLQKTIVIDGKQKENLDEVVSKLEQENTEEIVIKRSKGRKIAIIILVILMLAVIISVTCFVVKEKQKEITNSQTVNSNIFEKVTKNNSDSTNNTETEKEENKDEEETDKEYANIKDISLADFEKKILNKEDMVILVASSTCYYCATYEPVVQEVFKEADKTIYRFDISNTSDEDITTFRTYYSFTKAPTIFVIKDGIVTADLVGVKEKEELANWLKENF